MKKSLLFITVVCLILTLISPLTAQAAPVITLVQPASPAVQFVSGEANLITVNATSAGSPIISAEFQTFFNDPAGTSPAMKIFAQRPIAPGSARAGAAATSETVAVPAGLPATSVVSIVVFGTVSSVNTTSGEWQIGTPPVFVYERLDGATSIQGAPVVGSEVRVTAMRTLAPGPIVAETVTLLGAGTLPAPAPVVDRSFLFNGAIQAAQTGVQSAGIKLGGTTWTIGGVPFRIDDANFPAAIDPGIGPGPGLNGVVTVQFTTQLSTAVNTNVALEVFSPQALSAASGVLHPAPVINTEPAPMNLPAGSWKQLVIAGVVSANNTDPNNPDGPSVEWAIGNPPVFVYQSASTIIQGAPTVGTEVRVTATRTLAPGPLVATEIVRLSAESLIPGPPTVTGTFFFNGNVETADNATWTIGGANFVVNDPDLPAVLQAGLTVGSAVSVEYKFTGAPAPDAALWAPLQLNPATNIGTAVLIVPVSAARTGFLFLRATDAQQVVTAMVVPASLVARPPSSGGGGGGGGGTLVAVSDLTGNAPVISFTGVTQNNARLRTSDGTATLNIPANTKILDASGKPATRLAASVAESPPAPLPGNVVLLARDFKPDGLTFSPPITLTLSYDESSLSAGVTERDLLIAFWDGSKWMTMETTVNTRANTVSAAVSHFTVFAILGKVIMPPVLKITAPAETTLPPGSVRVEVSVENFELVAPGGAAREGQGHLLYYKDVEIPTMVGLPAITTTGTYQAASEISAIWENVTPGTHTFGVQLVRSDDTPLAPPVTATISVTVQAPAPSPAPTPASTPTSMPTPAPAPTPTPVPPPTPTPAPAPAPVPAAPVPAPTPAAAPAPDTNSTLIIGISGAAMVLIGLAILYARRRLNDL